MAKPSVTNIQPPLTPPQTIWHLDDPNDILAAGGNYVGSSDASGFAAKLGAINTIEPSARPDVTLTDLQSYDYVFFGVNGGSNETVFGKAESAGVIVTGNGKDSIFGGDLGDMIWAGNGKDTVHGGAGDDVIYGENGPDELHGDSDDGTANFSAGNDTLVINSDINNLWDHDPNGESDPSAIPNKTTVEKEGVYVAVDGNGHPTELDADGHPIVHVVYSVTPETTGTYTIVYESGNQLDGPGEPDPDSQVVTLTAGNTYYFSFIYDPTDTQPVRADVFAGNVTITNPINDGPGGNPSPVATSQALPAPDWSSLFHTEGDGLTFSVVAGDELIGGAGPDKFVYDQAQGPNNVDLIWDFNQGTGAYDPLEGDQLILLNTGLSDVSELQTLLSDLNGDGNDDLVIYLGADHAIGLVGITNISQVDVIFG